MKTFKLDSNSKTTDFLPYWNVCVGSCHAATALRADWQNQLSRCRRDIGFRYVRFHGLFDDDMSVAVRPMMAKSPEFCFTNIDKIYDFLLSIGMKPFVELGFMPQCFASGDTTVFHYKGNTSPPRDYEEWAAFIKLFLNHVIERYGRGEVRTWFFEVWNEPNLGGPGSPFGFWSGSKEEYFKLYNVTANAIKEIDASLRVGGPATSNNAWIPEFIDYCSKSGAPLDFISTHHYPTDIVVGYGVEDSGNFSNPFDLNKPEKLMELFRRVDKDPDELNKIKEEYSVFQSHLWENVERGVLTDMARRAKKEAQGLPLYYTEWGSLAGLPSDGSFGSSFLVKTILDNHGLTDIYSFWLFTDIMEESGQMAPAFHGGFGLMNQQGIPKAPYRAYELLNKLGVRRYESTLCDGTVDVQAFYNDEQHSIQLLAVNHQSLLHEINEEDVHIIIENVGELMSAELIRIDDTHANPLTSWQQMGSPRYLTEKQRLALESASCLETEMLTPGYMDGRVELEIKLPPMGIALITLYCKGAAT